MVGIQTRRLERTKRETKREVVVMLVESGVEREAARAARYRITFACFCAARPAMPATHTHTVRFRLIAMRGVDDDVRVFALATTYVCDGRVFHRHTRICEADAIEGQST